MSNAVGKKKGLTHEAMAPTELCRTVYAMRMLLNTLRPDRCEANSIHGQMAEKERQDRSRRARRRMPHAASVEQDDGEEFLARRSRDG